MKNFAPHFIGEVKLTPRADGRTWSVDQLFEFMTEDNRLIVVPKGFVTDLASIPRLFWNILAPFGKYTDAAVIHDWMYRNKLFPRCVCDDILLEAMNVSRVSLWQRLIIYWNVRAFGWIAWRDEKRQLFRPKISHQ